MSRNTILDRQTDSKKYSLTDLPTDYSFWGIDLMKFICVLFVCANHIDPISGIDTKYIRYFNYLTQNGVCRIAVPLFFCASGFLLFRKIQCYCIDLERVQKYCLRNLKLMSIWMILLIYGATFHLWYLGGLVIATILISVLLYKGISFFRITLLSGVLYVIGLFFDSYYGFIETVSNCLGIPFISNAFHWIYTNCSTIFVLGVFSAPLFFCLGMLFAYCPIKMRNITAVAGASISIVLLIIEALLLKHYSNPLDHNMYISLFPSVFFVFYYATHIRLKERPIYYRLRIMGVLIYFLHLFVRDIGKILFGYLMDNYNINLYPFLFLFTIVIVTFIAFLIERLSKRIYWLKHLYS